MSEKPVREYVCAFCPSRRITLRGIESHILHKHRGEYERAIVTPGMLTFDVIR